MEAAVLAAATAPPDGGGMAQEVNEHFIRPTPPAKQRWELSHRERREFIKDPSIQKLIQEERQFDGTNMSRLWGLVRSALVTNCASAGGAEVFPASGWVFTHSAFAQFCRSAGVSSDLLVSRLTLIFDKDNTGCFNAVFFTKILQLLVNDEEGCPEYAEAAFDTFERPVKTADLSTAMLLQQYQRVQQAEAAVSTKGKGKRGAGGDAGRNDAPGATLQMLEAAKGCLRQHPRADLAAVTLSEFRSWWRRDAPLVAASLRIILEVTSHLFHSGRRELPKLPSAYLKSLEPIPGKPFADADWWLFTEYERLGGDPVLGAGKKKTGTKKKRK